MCLFLFLAVDVLTIAYIELRWRLVALLPTVACRQSLLTRYWDNCLYMFNKDGVPYMLLQVRVARIRPFDGVVHACMKERWKLVSWYMHSMHIARSEARVGRLEYGYVSTSVLTFA